MTFRCTSPQAEMVVSSAWLMPAMVGLEVALEHAVELEALPGGDPEGAVGVLVGDLLRAPRYCSPVTAPAGNRHPHHERVGLLLPGRLARHRRSSRESCW